MEILSGYVNGIFLVVIAFFVLTAALQRLFDPPTVKTEKLLVRNSLVNSSDSMNISSPFSFFDACHHFNFFQAVIKNWMPVLRILSCQCFVFVTKLKLQ